MDRITKLVEVCPSENKRAIEAIEIARDIKKNLNFLKDKYQTNIENEVVNRDLTSGKMKNPSKLKLDLPKFHGYSSKMDYYTFKSEFENLIVPHVHAKLLPDYLKN